MITGFFDSAFPWPVPKVQAGLFIDGITTKLVSVGFLLDTGASSTCLHPLDAVTSVGISTARLALPGNWTRTESRSGVGGSATYYVVPVTYAFLHHDRRLQLLETEISIAQLTVTNRSLPSLLGWDILQHFKVTVDWSERLVSLE